MHGFMYAVGNCACVGLVNRRTSVWFGSNMNVSLLIQCVFYFMCGKYPTPSHFPALRGSPWITGGECECTHALHGEMLYPTTSSAVPDASVGASVGGPQIGSRLVSLYV